MPGQLVLLFVWLTEIKNRINRNKHMNMNSNHQTQSTVKVVVDKQAWVMWGFGLIVLASGLWRYFGAEGGTNGLWFGVVMGGVAMASGGLFRIGMATAAGVLAWVSIALVGGWFGYEALIKKGITVAEPRQLIVIAVTILASLAMILL